MKRRDNKTIPRAVIRRVQPFPVKAGITNARPLRCGKR